jgi:large subunit ribosomal protein L13
VKDQMKTTLAKDPGVNREWWVVDARDRILGRMATQIANRLRGKDKPIYTPHMDTGDFVIVVNADKVKLSGRKETLKTYQKYSGWRGGRTETTLAKMRQQHPDRIVTMAVRGMLPKNKLSRQHLSRLKVYAGEAHPHAAQQPKVASL